MLIVIEFNFYKDGGARIGIMFIPLGDTWAQEMTHFLLEITQTCPSQYTKTNLIDSINLQKNQIHDESI